MMAFGHGAMTTPGNYLTGIGGGFGGTEKVLGQAAEHQFKAQQQNNREKLEAALGLQTGAVQGRQISSRKEIASLDRVSRLYSEVYKSAIRVYADDLDKDPDSEEVDSLAADAAATAVSRYLEGVRTRSEEGPSPDVARSPLRQGGTRLRHGGLVRGVLQRP